MNPLAISDAIFTNRQSLARRIEMESLVFRVAAP